MLEKDTGRRSRTEYHTIWGKTKAGELIRLFQWRGHAKDGIARAQREAAEFGFTVNKVWAERIS